VSAQVQPAASTGACFRTIDSGSQSWYYNSFGSRTYSGHARIRPFPSSPILRFLVNSCPYSSRPSLSEHGSSRRRPRNHILILLIHQGRTVTAYPLVPLDTGHPSPSQPLSSAPNAPSKAIVASIGVYSDDLGRYWYRRGHGFGAPSYQRISISTNFRRGWF
jgi:hypothetical protein